MSKTKKEAKGKYDCAYDELVDVSKLLLIQNPKNNNKHSKEQIERLAKIIDFQGQRSPIVVSKRSGFLVKGHGRLFALEKLGWDKAAVDYQDYLTEAQEYADMTADNEIARWAEFDEEKFLIDIKDIKLGDYELLGLGEIPNISAYDKKGLTDPDEAPEVAQNIHNVQLGQIWKLGEHRLMCGDSTDAANVEKLMNGEKVVMAFTSPPYNIAKNGFEEIGKYNNDTDDKENFKEFLSKFINTWRKYSTYQFVNLQFVSANKVSIIEWLNEQRQYIVDFLACAKDSSLPAMEKNILNADFEMVYVFGESNRTRHIKCGKEFRGNVSNLVQMKRNRSKVTCSHRAGFDVSFPFHFIENLTSKDSMIADPFGGTGSTMIACEKTNRKCFMMELDPHYCSVIIERWQNFTGQKAELLNG